MKALKVRAWQFIGRSEFQAYKNCDFRIANWRFTWKEAEKYAQSLENNYSTIDDKVLVINGGFLGRKAMMPVMNPMQLLIALATGKACEVVCGERIIDSVCIKFSKRAIRNVVVYKTKEENDTTTDYSSNESGSSYKILYSNDGEDDEGYEYINEQQEEVEVMGHEEQKRYDEMQELRGVWRND